MLLRGSFWILVSKAMALLEKSHDAKNLQGSPGIWILSDIRGYRARRAYCEKTVGVP
jgi:hypothetical protein